MCAVPDLQKARHPMLGSVTQRLHAKSTALLLSIEGGLPRIMTGWFVAAMLACALRIAISPIKGRSEEHTSELSHQ